jgi:hypothetical protein
MQSLNELTGLHLEWREPKAMQQRYELRSGSAHYATLEFQSSWDTAATATTGMGTWDFQRTGLLNPQVTVRAPGVEADLAVFRTRFWGEGVLTLADGTAYHWRPVNTWNTRWAFFDSGDRPLVTFHTGVPMESFSDLFRNQSSVFLDPSALKHPHLGLLVTLGWYLHLLHQVDAANSTAALGAIM